MLNNTRLAGKNLVYFNRVAKVGSESMMELLNYLAAFNAYDVSKGVDSNQISFLEQRTKAEVISGLPDETVLIEHSYYINFTKFKEPQPIYMNLVRDPVERVISWYFYVRGAHKNALLFKKHPDTPMKDERWFKKDFNKCVRTADPECVYNQYGLELGGDFRRQSLFFCGYLGDCLPFNSPRAVQIAKQNVEKYYAVVGSWEDTNVTLTVLEKFIPRYFHGARTLFQIHHDRITNQNKNKRKPKIDDDVKEMIRKNFTQEYDFYYFCKQRLYRQYLSLHLDKLNDLSSLTSDSLNNTKYSDPELVFFNRVAKAGSESMMELLKLLGKLNGYRVAKDAVPARSRLLSFVAERSKVHRLAQLINETVYIEHLNYLNFSRFHLPNPIYINLVRDPVERVISWYFYARGANKNAIFFRKHPEIPHRSPEWYQKDFNTCVRTSDPECVYEQLTINDKQGDYKRQSLFFCGSLQECLPFNSPTAIQIAKQNVERYYAVVGSWEDTNVTLTVLEKFIPRYFQGVKTLFEQNQHQITNQNKNTRKPKIDLDVKDMIRKNFSQEYDFYYFCKQRLYKQYISLKLNESVADLVQT